MLKGVKEEIDKDAIVKEALLILIDDALDRNDRDKFLALTRELHNLSKKIG